MFRLTLTWTKPSRWYVDSRPALAAWWVVALGLMEAIGRVSTTDLGDAPGVLVLGSMVVLTVRHHRRDRIAILSRLTDRARLLKRRFLAHLPTLGVDFRGTPPLPRGFPPIGIWLLVATGGGAVILIALRAHLLGDLRETLRFVSGAASITLIALLWSLLAMTSVLFVAFAFGQLHDHLVNRGDISVARRGRIEFGAALSIVMTLVALSISFAPWLPLAIIAGIAIPWIGLLRVHGDTPTLMWRTSNAPPRAMAWRESEQCVSAIAACLIVGMVALAAGDHLVGDGGSTTPISGFLGAATAWAGVLGLAAWAWVAPIRAFWLGRDDPARRIAPRVSAGGALSGASTRTLTRAGFNIGKATRVSPDPVRIRLDPSSPRVGSALFDASVQWPLTVHPNDVEHRELHRLLKRRDDVQRRRQFMRGLSKTFRSVRHRRFLRGTGFWIAPQYWFVIGLGRDTQEEGSWSVGPPYHSTMSLAARSHVASVLDALDVDLIFVEDRVPFRHLKRVFWVLFDLYDIFGRTPIEERHFIGVPGLRVVIHDFTVGDPFSEKGYPEPDYEEIGRARILHVFKDRGEEGETADDPVLSDLVPEPALA